MAAATQAFTHWLDQAQIRESALSPEQLVLLQAVFAFRQRQGTDYYSTRLLSHFLLHCDCRLKVAQIARLLALSRPTASRQQGLSSKQAIQGAHHRLEGRPYGKLLPRYAGPIAEFLCTRPDASRADLLDFIAQTWNVRVSTVAVFKFLKKYGLDRASRQAVQATVTPPAAAATDRSTPRAAFVPPPASPSGPHLTVGQPLPTPTPPFSSLRPNTPAPSCSCRRPSPG
jgi:hypothetical protein